MPGEKYYRFTFTKKELQDEIDKYGRDLKIGPPFSDTDIIQSTIALMVLSHSLINNGDVGGAIKEVQEALGLDDFLIKIALLRGSLILQLASPMEITDLAKADPSFAEVIKVGPPEAQTIWTLVPRVKT